MSSDAHILAEELADFCNALEAACVKLRRQAEQLTGSHESVGLTWDPEKIKWQNREGQKGPFQISEDVDSTEFKAMLKDIVAHKGFLLREGVNYWVFENGWTVGRKRKAAATK